MKYPYKCSKCKTAFDISLSLKDYNSIVLVTCPLCQSDHVTREYFSIPAHYVGSGFTKSVNKKDKK